ncbi:hypothetical protein [Streptomyces sp. NPDC003015]
MASSAPARLLTPTSDEDRRTATGRKYPVDTSSGHALDKIASLATRIFGAPMASVAIVDTDRVRLIASHGPVGATKTVRVIQTGEGLLGGLGPGVDYDTALLALSVPVPPASPQQENR